MAWTISASRSGTKPRSIPTKKITLLGSRTDPLDLFDHAARDAGARVAGRLRKIVFFIMHYHGKVTDVIARTVRQADLRHVEFGRPMAVDIHLDIAHIPRMRTQRRVFRGITVGIAAGVEMTSGRLAGVGAGA